MQNGNDVTRRVHKYTFHQHRNPNSLRDTGNNTTHILFEGKLAVKLHANYVEVGTSSVRIPRQTKSPLGGLTVLDLLATKVLVLLGFSIMHQ